MSSTKRRIWNQTGLLFWTLMLITAALIWVLLASSDSTAIVLSDGSEVRYVGFVRGKPLPHSEFEQAIYAYDQDSLDPPGMVETLERVFKRRSIDRTEYVQTPLLLRVRVGGSSRFEGKASLQDHFGAIQELVSPRPPLFFNKEAVPRRSPVLSFRFSAYSVGASGVLRFRNPFHNPIPAFVGKQPPINASTAIGSVQLLRAVWRNLESDSPSWPSVLLEFDVSNCNELLPCHVIGVRITDCWGNSELVDGSLANDGRTVHAVWEPAGRGGTTLQDAHWRVRLALSRGLGAKVPPSRVAAFNSIPLDDAHARFSDTKAIGPQQLSLTHHHGREGREEEHIRRCFATLELPSMALDDWPILVGVTGHLVGGGTDTKLTK